MKIYGYSERGAMNALFYGMAHDKEKGEKSMSRFINELANIPGNFSEFELYNEFSLSEFGDPDMMIIATETKEEQSKKVVFFIEAKRSGFKLSLENTHHTGYMKKGEFHNGHSSNLFFQLRLKRYFISRYISKIIIEKGDLEKLFHDDEDFRLRKTKDRSRKLRERKIGENVVVEKIVNRIKECKQDYYIAIIPEQDSRQTEKTVNTDIYGFPTHTIIWEDIIRFDPHKEGEDTPKFSKYVEETFGFNQNKGESQILNQPMDLF